MARAVRRVSTRGPGFHRRPAAERVRRGERRPRSMEREERLSRAVPSRDRLRRAQRRESARIANRSPRAAWAVLQRPRRVPGRVRHAHDVLGDGEKLWVEDERRQGRGRRTGRAALG